MANIHFHKNRTRNKSNRLYLFYNKILNAYKFGVTNKSLEDRIESYCKNPIILGSFFYKFETKDIEVILNIEAEEAEKIESELSKMINGHRLKLEGQTYRFREHFVGEKKAKEIINYINGNI